jgi:elongation factor Ts
MSITAADVNKLRQMTGAGMMDCKKALTEADGNFDDAVVVLRKKGQKVSAARADRETTEGAVFIHTNDTHTAATVVGLGCETDFVAKTDDFINLGNTILSIAVAHSPATTEELLANTATPDGRSINEHMMDLTGKIGEKVDIVGYSQVSGEKIATYRHFNGKIGVVLELSGVGSADVAELGGDLALQIAALKPVAVNEDDVDATIIEKEVEIGKELARNEGKAEAMLDKIAQGRLQKFFKENTLYHQQSLADESKTVRQLMDTISKDLKVVRFSRVAI